MDWFEDVVAFDLETTGLSPARDRVVQAAAIRFVGGEEVERFETFVDPGVKFRDGINAVRVEDVRGAPRFPEVSGALVRELLAAGSIMIYNAPFDVDFLRSELRRARRRIPAAVAVDRVLDPLIWVRDADRYVPGPGRHKLTMTAERRGVEVDGEAHSADVDCRLLFGVARTLRRDVPRDLAELLAWQNRLRVEQLEERREFRRRLKERRG